MIYNLVTYSPDHNTSPTIVVISSDYVSLSLSFHLISDDDEPSSKHPRIADTLPVTDEVLNTGDVTEAQPFTVPKQFIKGRNYAILTLSGLKKKDVVLPFRYQNMGRSVRNLIFLIFYSLFGLIFS